MKPILQALVLAERVYEDISGKKTDCQDGIAVCLCLAFRSAIPCLVLAV
jgi:hypothetical protein